MNAPWYDYLFTSIQDIEKIFHHSWSGTLYVQLCDTGIVIVQCSLLEYEEVVRSERNSCSGKNTMMSELYKIGFPHMELQNLVA